jgi:hypothetical protein
MLRLLPQRATGGSEWGGDTAPHSSQTCPVAVPQAHATTATILTGVHNTYVMRQKNITIREDQAEWVEENHLNLSSFVRGQLDELTEERS